MSGPTLDRVASMCDEMLRRGVPAHIVQPTIEWIDAQRNRVHDGAVFRSHLYSAQPCASQFATHTFELRCVYCRKAYEDGEQIGALNSCPGAS